MDYYQKIFAKPEKSADKKYRIDGIANFFAKVFTERNGKQRQHNLQKTDRKSTYLTGCEGAGKGARRGITVDSKDFSTLSTGFSTGWEKPENVRQNVVEFT